MALRTMTILAILATPAALAATLPASAQGYRQARPFHPVYPAVAYGGFAQPFVQGDYIGAPFTRVPRPDRLVPTPWSYGTYGVPTVSGIAEPPVAQPTLTVIHPRGVGTGARAGASSAGSEISDMRVVSVSVPRR